MFEPDAFADLAQRLRADDHYEVSARTRTALGRAYYSLFLGVRAAIRKHQGRSVDDPVRHGQLKDALFASGQEDLKAVAMALDELYHARRNADYLLEPAAPWESRLRRPKYAKAQAQKARGVLDKLASLDFSAVADRV